MRRIIMLAKPDTAFSKFSIPFGFILQLGLRTLISGLEVLGIQFMFSVIISGFLLPFSLGLASTSTGLILFGFGKALWWPYSAPALTVTNPEGSEAGNILMHYERLSMAWMLIAQWLGYQWYQRKTFTRAFFKPVIRLLYSVAPVIIFISVFNRKGLF
jgi:hypothetical protein